MELSPQVKTQLLNLQQSFSELIASPVSPDKFHITLSYLGNTTEKQLETILDNFSPLSLAAFDINLHEMIYWTKPSIIGLTIADQENKLKQCKKQIEKQLSQVSFFTYDKKTFIPHITLLRNVEPPLIDNQLFDHTLANAHIPTAPIQVDRVTLLQSQTSQTGVHYQIIEEWELQNPSVKQQLLGR